jgi:thiol peroxidase
MSRVYLDDEKIETSGDLPAIVSQAPDFELVIRDFSVVTLSSFVNKNIVLNVFPSLDTGTCSASIRRFNIEASKLKDTVIVCASMDSPFACLNFCDSNKVDNVIIGSDIRNRALGANYGLTIIDSALAGLLARAVVVIDKSQKIIYTELVTNINNAPNYDAALSALKNI